MLVAQSCLTLGDPVDCSPPGSSVHGVLQARILEWVTIPFSKGSFWPRDWIWVPCIAGAFFTIWAAKEALISYTSMQSKKLKENPHASIWPYNQDSLLTLLGVLHAKGLCHLLIESFSELPNLNQPPGSLIFPCYYNPVISKVMGKRTVLALHKIVFPPNSYVEALSPCPPTTTRLYWR